MKQCPKCKKTITEDKEITPKGETLLSMVFIDNHYFRHNCKKEDFQK